MQPKKELPRKGPTPAVLQLQLWARRKKHRIRRLKLAGDGGQRPSHLLQGSSMVLDDQRSLSHQSGLWSYDSQSQRD